MKIKDIKLENSLWSAQLTIVSDDRQELERIFENAGKVDPEKEYTVKIEPRRKKRTLDANAYMWQLLNKLAEKVQNSPVELYKWFVRQYGQYYVIPVRADAKSAEFIRLSEVAEAKESGNALIQLWSVNATNYQIVKNSFMLFNLTLLFGAGNEPTAEQFEAMFPAESYPYNPGEIISSRTETITAGAETITTGFPELRSTTVAHDYINMDGEQTIRTIGKIKFNELKTKEFESGVFYINHAEIGAKQFNASCLTQGFAFIDEELVHIKPGECNGRGYYFRFKAPAEIDTVDKFMEKYGNDYIYFELETPTTEPVTIPEPLQEWLPVEPGGTVTFRNSDESKQLEIPNAVSWVRKLNEVN